MGWFEEYFRNKGLDESEKWHEGSGLGDHMYASVCDIKNTKMKVVQWDKHVYNTLLVVKSIQPR